jgi:hypothetical protein
MKRSRRITPSRRAKVLAAFERSGLSAAAFAREQGLNYTTFCGWRQRRAKIKFPPAFVEVEVPAATAPVDLSAEASSAKAELVVELGAQARMRLDRPGQIELATRLIQALNPKPACEKGSN